MTYKVRLTRTAVRMIEQIKDPERRQIQDKIKDLENDPEKQGIALSKPLDGLRRIKAAGGRYRIIYRVRNDRVEVLVLAAGIRKEGDKTDIYVLARKLIRQRLI